MTPSRNPGRRSDTTLTELFLDMLAAERGAGRNTLGAYSRDLTDFSASLAATKSSLASATRAMRCVRCARSCDRGAVAAVVSFFGRRTPADGQRPVRREEDCGS